MAGSLLLLYYLPNHIPHRIRCLPHHLRRGMGVGAEGEACTVMPQGAGQRLHVHAVLQGYGREGMSEVMEANVFGADSLQNLIVRVPERIWIEHGSRLGRREHIRIAGMLLVLIYHQSHCLLRNW